MTNFSYGQVQIDGKEESFPDIINYLNTVNKGSFSPNNAECDPMFKAIKIKKCGPQSYKIIAAVNEAANNLAILEDNINAYFQKPELAKDKVQLKILEKLKKRTKCMSEKMSTQIITCEISHPACSHGAHAFVENFYFWTFNTVKICIESLDRSIDVLSGYLIHETSHLCGARDHYNKPISDYFIKYNPKAIISPDKAGKPILNLDSAQIYDYWVLNGFCLPGFDCPNFD